RSGKEIHWYDCASKRVILWPVVQLNSKGPASFSRWFFRAFVDLGYQMAEEQETIFLGRPVADLKRRFKVSLNNEDARWVWVKLEPRSSEQRAWFKMIQVLLDKKSFLVRQVIVYQPNDNEIRWTLTDVKTNVKPRISAETLAHDLPMGFEKINVSDLWDQ